MKTTTKYNIIRFKPFANNSEAIKWMENNCKNCKRQQCYTKRILRLSLISGTIPFKRAKWIGYNKNGLNDTCNYHNKQNRCKVLNNNHEDKFNYNAF